MRVSPLAWFRKLPDLAQAIALGLAIAVPAVAIVVVAFGFPKPDQTAQAPDLVLPAGTPALAADATVYVTRRGTRYHKEACAQLVGMGVPLVFREAVREYIPCRECWLFSNPSTSPQPVQPGVQPEKIQAPIALVANPTREEKKASYPSAVPDVTPTPAAPEPVEEPNSTETPTV